MHIHGVDQNKSASNNLEKVSVCVVRESPKHGTHICGASCGHFCDSTAFLLLLQYSFGHYARRLGIHTGNAPQGPSHFVKTRRHPQNLKYITYRNAVRGGPRHGHRQHTQKL